MNNLQKIDSTLKPYLSFLDNEYANAALLIVLIAYTSFAAPRLPEKIAKYFGNPVVVGVLFFLIAYTAKHNVSVAIIAAIGVLVSLMALNKIVVTKETMGNLSDSDAVHNLDTCNGWDCNKLLTGEQVVQQNEIVPYEDTNSESEGYPLDHDEQNYTGIIEEIKSEIVHIPEIVQEVKQDSVSLLHRGLKFLHLEGYENTESNSYASA